MMNQPNSNDTIEAFYTQTERELQARFAELKAELPPISLPDTMAHIGRFARKECTRCRKCTECQ